MASSEQVMLIGYQQLQRRIAAIKGPVLGKAIMSDLADATKNEAGNLVPHKTRNLAHTIHVAEVTETTARVVASANYAAAVEFGTRPHEITPNAKKALAFASQGITSERFGPGAILKFTKGGNLTAGSMRKFGNAAFIIVKKVHHPGTRAQPFMRPGAEKAIKSAGLLDRVIAAWNGAA